ncbi:hypothetical protein YC2023_037462 [Brassica napus]
MSIVIILTMQLLMSRYRKKIVHEIIILVLVFMNSVTLKFYVLWSTATIMVKVMIESMSVEDVVHSELSLDPSDMIWESFVVKLCINIAYVTSTSFWSDIRQTELSIVSHIILTGSRVLQTKQNPDGSFVDRKSQQLYNVVTSRFKELSQAASDDPQRTGSGGLFPAEKNMIYCEIGKLNVVVHYLATKDSGVAIILQTPTTPSKNFEGENRLWGGERSVVIPSRPCAVPKNHTQICCLDRTVTKMPVTKAPVTLADIFIKGFSNELTTDSRTSLGSVLTYASICVCRLCFLYDSVSDFGFLKWLSSFIFFFLRSNSFIKILTSM